MSTDKIRNEGRVEEMTSDSVDDRLEDGLVNSIY